MVILLLALGVGCTAPAPAPDPELAAMKVALEASERGERALAAGQPDEAVLAFRAAQSARPRDVLLRGWLAKALAASGELDGAIAELDTALRAHPNEPLLQYQRAAYLARAGRPEAAAADLEAALKGGARPPREVLEDPDFVPWLAHPALGFLPTSALGVSVDLTEGPVFWGSELTVALRVAGAGEAPVEVSVADASGPVRLVRVGHDTQQTTDGVHQVLSWVFRVEGAGEVVLGPITVRAGPREARLEPLRVATAAPAGKGPPAQLLPVSLPVMPAAAPPPAAWLADGWLWVSAGPASVVKLEPELSAGGAVRFERKAGGRVSAVLWRWPAPAGPVGVRIVEGGRERFAATVAPAGGG